MNIVNDYFVCPQPKSNRKTNLSGTAVKKLAADCKSMSEQFDDVFYETRKIKIRLADPAVPDSYVCEVYDTSLEEDNTSNVSTNEPTLSTNQPSATLSINEPRKNCAFSVLMAGTGKQAKSQKRTRPAKRVAKAESGSSDDEALIFVKKKLKITSESGEANCQNENIQHGSTLKNKNASNSRRRKKKALHSTEASSECYEESVNLNSSSPRAFRKTSYKGDSKSISTSTKISSTSRHQKNLNVLKSMDSMESEEESSVLNDSSSRFLRNIESKKNSKSVDNTPTKLSTRSKEKTVIANESIENGIGILNATCSPLKVSRQIKSKKDSKSVSNTPTKLSTGSKEKALNANKSIENGIGILNANCSPLKVSRQAESKDDLRSLDTPSKMSTRSKDKMTSTVHKTPEASVKSINAIINSSPSIVLRKIDFEEDFKAVYNEPFKVSPRSKSTNAVKSLNSLSTSLGNEENHSQRSVPNIKKRELKRKSTKKHNFGIEKYFSPSNKDQAAADVECVQNECQQKSTVRCEKASQGIAQKGESRSELLDNKECCVVLEKINIAPMFLNTRKPVVDPEVLKARQAFLQKGLPAAMQRKMLKGKAEVTDVPLFPPVYHIHQDNDHSLWKKRDITLHLNTIDFNCKPLIDWKPMINDQPSECITHGIFKPSRVNTVETHLKTLMATYKNIKIKYLYYSLREKKELYEHGIEPVWTDKYKLNSSEFFSNENSVAKLEKWLLSWKRYGENMKAGATSQDSSDDFVSSDEESEKSHAPATACLLQGPVSSGKTALVQALAAQLDFNILEVNCSSKRAGKKMLADLQEATKSHKILQEADGNVGTSTQGEKMAIIVVEEADIIFEEQDDGFVSGLQTLVNSARRPVLLLTSEPSVCHLEKFRSFPTKQLKLVRPYVTSSCAFLELVALVEGIVIPRPALLKMMSVNKWDLRQSLLELQFWIQHSATSSSSPIKINQGLNTENVWWVSHQLLFGRNLWHSKVLRKKEDKITDVNQEESKTVVKKITEERPLMKIFDYFESLSLCDMLERKTASSNLEITNFETKIKDSSYLCENLVVDNCAQNALRNDVIEEILLRSLHQVPTKNHKYHLHSISTGDMRWLSSQEKATAELTQVVPARYSHSDRQCDYLPCLRQICRVEEKREKENTKRRKRFNHYLKALGGSPTENNLKINCSVFIPG